MLRKIIYQLSIIILPCLLWFMFDGQMVHYTVLVLLFLLYSLLINMKGRKLLYAWVILPVWAFMSFKYSNGFACSNIYTWLFPVIGTTVFLAVYCIGFLLSKCRKKVVLLSILIVVLLILYALFNVISHSLSFMMTGLIYLAAPHIAYRYISQNRYIPLLIIFPLILLNLDSWISGSIGTLPLTLIPLCSIIVYYSAFLLRKRRIALICLISIYVLFLSYGWYRGLESYKQWILVQQSKLPQDTCVEYTFYDLHGLPVSSFDLRGKITVLISGIPGQDKVSEIPSHETVLPP